MSAPYTIEKTAEMSGLSVKYIRRLKSAMPKFFEKYTDRGMNNALLFEEEMVEILKRTRELKNRGKTLAQIRNELMQVAKREKEKKNRDAAAENSLMSDSAHSPLSGEKPSILERNQPSMPLTKVLQRENDMLKSQVELLKHLLKKAEDRFDRLLPEPGKAQAKVGQSNTNPIQTRREGIKSQLVLWLVEAVVVTIFAAGFIFLVWLFAQRAFSL